MDFKVGIMVETILKRIFKKKKKCDIDKAFKNEINFLKESEKNILDRIMLNNLPFSYLSIKDLEEELSYIQNVKEIILRKYNIYNTKNKSNAKCSIRCTTNSVIGITFIICFILLTIIIISVLIVYLIIQCFTLFQT